MTKQANILALMAHESNHKDWHCFNARGNQAVHRVAMTASRRMVTLLDRFQQSGEYTLSIADRFKIIEMAAARFKKVANDYADDGAADAEPRFALRHYCARLLQMTGMDEKLYDEFLFQTF